MNTETLELTAFEARHLDGAVGLSRAAGWPHRREDWALSLSVSTGVVALEGDRVVGTALMTPYGEASATINLIIVDPQMRGRGLGRRLTSAVLALAGERVCRLVATADGLPLYEKLGFTGMQEIYQHQGFAEVSLPLTGFEWAGAASLPDLAALDGQACGGDRRDLLQQIAGTGQFAILRRAGAIVAFAAVRPFGRGQVIGPVVAPDEEMARQLIRFVAASREGRFLRIDVPGDSGLSHWLDGLGFTRVGGGVATPRGDGVPRQLRTARTFALASQAFG